METRMDRGSLGGESPDLNERLADNQSPQNQPLSPSITEANVPSEVSEAAEPKANTKKRPATTEESVEFKLRTYLLDFNNDDGKSKADWFGQALGFHQGNIEALAKQIIFDPSTAVETEITPHGVKFNQIISIVGHKGRTIDVRFTWIRNNDGVMRLVTGVPAPGRKGKHHV